MSSLAFPSPKRGNEVDSSVTKAAKSSTKEESRVMTITEPELLGLAQEVRKVFGSGSGIILHQAGLGIGQEMAGSIKSPADKAKEAFMEFGDLLKSRGWGTVTVEIPTGSADSGRVSFSDLPLPKDDPVHETVEMLLKGMFVGFTAKVFNTDRVSLQREKCVARGDTTCVFSFRVEEGD
jgi:predicted hydrocarbon binding protein